MVSFRHLAQAAGISRSWLYRQPELRREIERLRARWYQAQTGGFTARDPDFAGTDTAYTYAGDDPVNEADPSGLSTQSPITVETLGCGRTVGTSPYGVDLVMEWECDEHALVWALSLIPAVQALVVGHVTETGMAWYRNGVFKGRGSEHVRAEGRFHGTLAPVDLGNFIDMDDILRWDMELGDNEFAATAHMTPRFLLAKNGVKGFVMGGPVTAGGSVMADNSVTTGSNQGVCS